MLSRRSFLKNVSATGLLLGAGAFPLHAMCDAELVQLTILHTNDVHSRVEPFPSDGGRNSGLGGAARRAKLIESIRKQQKNVLLLDAGDIFQGTPYFNYFGGELEFKLMSKMGYDVATIGNHDFDAGIDGLYKQLPNANFDFVNCNYDWKDTVMSEKVSPYRIYDRSGIRIGVLGLGVKLEGLVPKNLYGDTQYQDPIKMANKYAAILKHDERCDYIICLSHLGYQYDESDIVCDTQLAKASRNIDLIIGGHTHTFLDEPDVYINHEGKEVLVNQVGWAGIMLGRLDIVFERNKKRRCITCKNLPIQ